MPQWHLSQLIIWAPMLLVPALALFWHSLFFVTPIDGHYTCTPRSSIISMIDSAAVYLWSIQYEPTSQNTYYCVLRTAYLYTTTHFVCCVLVYFWNIAINGTPIDLHNVPSGKIFNKNILKYTTLFTIATFVLFHGGPYLGFEYVDMSGARMKAGVALSFPLILLTNAAISLIAVEGLRRLWLTLSHRR
jgi:hypothetical protein